MNIWVDGFEANVKERLGSGQVAFYLLKYLEKLDKKNNYTILLPSMPLEDLPKERDNWHYKVLKFNKLWTRVVLPFTLFRAKIKPDIFFSPTHYIPRFSSVKRVATIFDLSFLHYPQMFLKADLFKLKNGTAYSAENADHLITISQFSKRDIMKKYKLGSNKVTICYPGYDHKKYFKTTDPDKLTQVLDKYQIKDQYILFIGTVQPRKNLKMLIESFVKIENLKLVVVGKISGQGRQGWMNEEILALPSKLGIENKILFTGYVPDEELLYLLNGATSFILPSLWEGFGIPVVEAMACGTPVIVSNVSSLPEVVGDAGLLVDPKSKDQIEQSIRLISTDKKLHLKLSKKSLNQSQKFSWEKMASKVLKVFDSLNSV